MFHIKTPLKACAARQPRRRNCNSVMFLLLGVLLGVAYTSPNANAEELGHQLARLKEPVKAPGFDLLDLDENSHSLQDYSGKVIMINFWATWCPPCRQEMPSLEAVYQDLKQDGFVVIAVNQWESVDLVFPYLGQLAVFPTFPILLDHAGKLSQAYDVKGLPTTFIVNRQGNIVYRAIGGRDFNHPQVKKLIRELL